MCSHKIDLVKEQYEIIKIDRRFREILRSRFEPHVRFSYNRLLGNMSCRIISYYLSKHIPSGYKVVQESYIYYRANNKLGIGILPIEYDIVIVREDAEPYKYEGIKTNIYNVEDTVFVIEVKSRGIISKNKDVLKNVVKRIADNLRAPQKYNENTKPVVLLLGEGCRKTKRGEDWPSLDRELFKKHGIPIFILSNTREKDIDKAVKPFKGEWEKFINYIVTNLKQL